MANWGDKFNNTLNARQAIPRNQKMGRPRYFYKTSNQPQPSNSARLRNVNTMIEPVALTEVSQDTLVVTFNVEGGAAPYMFTPGVGITPVEIEEAGEFDYDYTTEGADTYDVEIADSSIPALTDELEVVVA